MVELEVLSRVWPQFHIELMHRASGDPLSSQHLEDTKQSPISVEINNSSIQQEKVFERILRAEKFRQRKAWLRRVLVKWKYIAEPSWEDRSDLEAVEALYNFEKIYGKSGGECESDGV